MESVPLVQSLSDRWGKVGLGELTEKYKPMARREKILDIAVIQIS